MMTHPNQPQDQPILPTKSKHKAAAIRQSTILDSTIKAYYGPGQPPDAGEPTTYKPPTDWPEPGTPLTVPQIAWFVVNLPFSYLNPPPAEPYDQVQNYPGSGITYVFNAPKTYEEWFENTGQYMNFDGTAYANSGDPLTYAQHYIFETNGKVTRETFGGVQGGDPNLAQLVNEVVLKEGTLPPDEDGWYNYDFQVRPNAFMIERVRLHDIFDQVKERLKKLRPNRTYIEWIEPLELAHWSRSFFINGLSTNPSYVVNYDKDRIRYFLNKPYDPPDSYFQDDANLEIPPEDKIYPYFATVEYLWHLMCPNVEPKDVDYFGVNFLMLHCGFMSTTEEIIYVLDDTQTTDNNGEFYSDKISRITDTMLPYLQNAQDYFAGYSVRFYGLDLLIKDFEAPEEQTFDPNPKPDLYFGVNDYNLDVNTSVEPLGYGHVNLPEDIQDIIDGNYRQYTQIIDNANNDPNLIMTANNERLTEQANYLSTKKLDYKYVDTTNYLNVETLMQKIAEHFKFDPLTGKDND